MRFLKITLLITLLFFCSEMSAQENLRDLEKKAKGAEGLERVELFSQLCKAYLTSDPAKAVKFGNQAVSSADDMSKQGMRLDVVRAKADVQFLLGKAYLNQGNQKKAEKEFQNCLESGELINYVEKVEQAESILDSLNQPVASEPDPPVEEPKEEEQGPSWLERQKQGLKRSKEKAVNSYDNLKETWTVSSLEAGARKEEALGNYYKAIKLYLQKVPFFEEENDQGKIAEVYTQVGEWYQQAGDLTASLDYFDRASLITRDIGDTDRAEEAVERMKKLVLDIDTANKLPSELDSLEDVRVKQAKELRNLSEKLAEEGDFEGSLEALRDYALLQAKIDSVEQAQERIMLESKLLVNRRERELESFKQEQARKALETDARIQRQRVILISLSGGILVVILIALVLYILFRNKKRSHEELDHAYQDLEEAHDKLKTAQSNLVEAEKMASLGQLTAGIAHEINNPINFVSANVSPLKKDLDDLTALLQKYETLHEQEDLKPHLEEIEKLREELEPEFLYQEINSLLNGIGDGAHRTKEIVQGLRNFSRLDEDSRKSVDVREGLKSTLVILRNEMKDRIELKTDLGEIPLIECYPGKLNQVFMNLIGNAIQAIEGKGEIHIRTWSEKENIFISIRDSGKGMSSEVQQRIFEPFYTTKDVGKGTGLGLSISFGIIENHGGEIKVESEEGKGSEFVIRLPILREK